MPQSRPELHAFWETDANAWDHLKENFTEEQGLIRKKSSSYTPTFVDFQAIEYLCDEWDYDYGG